MTKAPILPERDEFSRAFIQEAKRHLSDSRLLAEHRHAPASITSSMKAVELGVKAALILNNVMGVYEKVFATHAPLNSIENHPYLGTLAKDLENQRDSLFVEDLKELERLEPISFGAQFNARSSPATNSPPDQANTEYPYLEAASHPVSSQMVLCSPGACFTDVQATHYYNLAHELLEVVITLYPIMSTWVTDMPNPL